MKKTQLQQLLGALAAVVVVGAVYAVHQHHVAANRTAFNLELDNALLDYQQIASVGCFPNRPEGWQAYMTWQPGVATNLPSISCTDAWTLMAHGSAQQGFYVQAMNPDSPALQKQIMVAVGSAIQIMLSSKDYVTYADGGYVRAKSCPDRDTHATIKLIGVMTPSQIELATGEQTWATRVMDGWQVHATVTIGHQKSSGLILARSICTKQ